MLPPTDHDWSTVAQQEAEHVTDPGWTAEARAYARRERRHVDLTAFGLGLLIVTAVQGLLLARFLLLTGTDLYRHLSIERMMLLSQELIVVVALAVLWRLGQLGCRAWPVALAFALTMPLGMATLLLYLAVVPHNMYEIRHTPSNLLGTAFSAVGQVAVAYLAVTLGARTRGRRRSL